MKSAVTLQCTYLVGCARGNSSAFPPLSQAFSVRPSSHSSDSSIVLKEIPRILPLPLLPRPLQPRSSRHALAYRWVSLAHAWEEQVWGDEAAAMLTRRKTCASRLACWWHSKVGHHHHRPSDWHVGPLRVS